MSNRKKTTTRGRPSKFPPEFRRDAVRMVIDEDRPIAEVGRAIGVNPGTLGNWVGLERIERGEREGLTADERADLADLRAENAQLRMERDLLKRSLAFWVRETSTP
jgi:transposase